MSASCSAGLLDAAFGEHSQILTPWPRAPRTKHRPLFDAAAVEEFVAQPPRLVDVDPADLYCTQNWVLRGHVSYYLSGEWEATGRTSADMHRRANRYPLVYVDARGRQIILAGHHRSMAARLEERPVRARVVGSSPAGRVVVTPTLEVDGPTLTAVEVEGLVAELASRGLADDECRERIRFTRLPVEE
ncbi:hypothetical protein [Ilumatobacter coccineus]|uniref:ParB/Sulfiredoxin domain-containing protein n=1 Tax=Ilumatobacter coccineus (strain NBRC 103263 / KCTC 29153 / YM16-304) TaxID=1313172 RepID=A0A6C7EDM4_ILUCY|nr:hypothetical protein [Ilumatobacter coccineus]BAN04413.1 hypothetical protein YM304_40990 [Ilumatobacter coccineus YM16-304]